HWPHEISGGQQQRVALARPRGPRPPRILRDEHFFPLDTGLRAKKRQTTPPHLAAAGGASIMFNHQKKKNYSQSIIKKKN
ncbi:hypothetical protein ACVGWE_17040, partial [Enterobacter mori]